MALTVSELNGQYVVGGITSDTNVTAPLGRQYYRAGPHLLGFDDNFAEPVIVRAYYDPTQDPALRQATSLKAVQYVGYVQFMRLAFRGMPIPPDVYGGKLADRAPYVYGRDLRFVDFMGPADARLRELYTPLYPYNALLANDIRDHSAFFRHPQPNGSLWSPGSFGTTQSRAASLFGEIAPGLVTPAALVKVLTPDNQILQLSPTPQDLAKQEPYRLALTALKTTPQDAPPLAGLDESQVAAQIIGDYVLLTLPDSENFGATLVISTAPRNGGGTDVIVHLLSEYDMTDLSYNVAQDTLMRIREYQLKKGLVNSKDLNPAPAGRGSNGLYTPPFRFTADEYAIDLTYWTVAIAVKAIGNELSRYMLSGITWSALFQYDQDTGLMNFATIKAPRSANHFRIAPGLQSFDKALGSKATASAVIDTSNFTKAAMVRDNFAGGSKLSFID